MIIDAGEGTLALAREVRRVLEARGLPAQLSWEETLPDPALRMRAGIGAPLFISLARAPLGAERFNLYYLTEGGYLDGENGLNGENGGALAEGLGAGIRQVAPEQLSELGPTARARLEPLVANLAQGEALARLLGAGLEARTGLELGELGGAPLYLLSGAAGRGVMLELSTDVPASPGLVAALADTLIEALPVVAAATAPLSESP